MAISNYVPSSRIAQSGVCTSSTRPASPFEGQMIYETDTNRVLIWDNAAWVMIADTDQPPGMQLIGTFTASATSRALVCDNIFSTEFSNYRVVLSLNAVSTSNQLYFQFLNTAGTVIGANYYSSAYGQDYTSGSTSFSGVLNNTDRVNVGWIPTLSDAFPLSATMDIYNPRATIETAVSGQHNGIASGVSFFGGAFYACTTVTTEFRGIRFDNIGGTNLTGTVRIYGYRD